MPTHSGRSAVTDANEFDYYRVSPWEKLSNILSWCKVSLAIAYMPHVTLHKVNSLVSGFQPITAT